MSFGKDQIFAVLDYETRSRCDLKKSGAYEYARHPSTRVLCVAWRIGTLKQLAMGETQTQVWSPAIPSPYGELKRALLDPTVILVAHNDIFEQCITRFVLPRIITNPEIQTIPLSRWICTASMARALAFPGKLVDACQAIGLPVQKDMEGHRLMLKMSKPRPAWNKWVREGRPPARVIRTQLTGQVFTRGGEPKQWHQSRKDLLRLMEYCKTDVDAEVALFTRVPGLSPAEREVWLLDHKINLRGFETDRVLVKKILGMIDEEMTRFEKVTRELTGGVVTSTAQRDATLKWMRENGLDLPNLQKKTVEDAIGAGLATGKAGDLLRVRQAASKSSTAKYAAFENRSRSDGRVRDNLVYHTASTGRWGGAGVQPQNFPARGIVEDTDHACEILADPGTDLELIRQIWGNPLDFFSSLLRSMIRASDGKRLFGGDFAGIEVRVLFWIAKHVLGLEMFRKGDIWTAENKSNKDAKNPHDPYIHQAVPIYAVEYALISKLQRDVGKRAVLGCLAEDTPVKTRTGLKAIQVITGDDEIWNGKEWIKGIVPINRGLRNVIRVKSLRIESTPDHWFLTRDGWQTAVEIDSLADIPLPELERASARSLLPGTNSGAVLNVVSPCAALAELKRNSGSINFGEALAHVTDALNLERDKKVGHVDTLTSSLIGVLENAGSRASITFGVDASTLVRKTSSGMGVAVLDANSAPVGNFWNTLLLSLGLINGVSRWTELRLTGTMLPETYESSLKKLTTETKPTFDLSPVPETNAFALNGILAHNCGFGMGKDKFFETCKAFGQEIEPELAATAVSAYRRLHAPVVRLWSNLEKAAIAAVQHPGKKYTINRTSWWVEGKYLYCALPSGRRLAYYGPKIKQTITPWGEKRPTLYHWDVHPKTRKWVFIGTYGGKLTENVVQATARDLMAASMLRVEKAGYEVLITVHDEILAERKIGTGSEKEFEKLMADKPSWAAGLPVAVESWNGMRYKK